VLWAFIVIVLVCFTLSTPKAAHATLKMAAPDLSQPFDLPHPLPPGFRTIEDIQSMPSQSIKAGTMVSVIGFVKDFRPPVRTNGTGMLLAPRRPAER
jgi:hypothetical protein